MIGAIVAVLLAIMPIRDMGKYTIDGVSPVVANHNVKLVPDSTMIIGSIPPAEGWRTIAPPYQRNILFIAPDTFAVIWAPYSGDTTDFFLGAKVSYSFDGGNTWSHYDLDVTTLHHRLYPSSYFDEGTGTPWFAWMMNSSTEGLKIFVAKDAAFPFGVFSTTEITYNTDSLYPYLPSIIADGDNVSVVAIDLANGHIAWWKSTDGGVTFTEDFTTLTQLFGGDYDTPFQLYKDGRLFVVTADAGDSIMKFAYSDDFGDTWNGPFEVALPVKPEYSYGTWWDNYDAILDNNGNLHVVAGVNFTTIYHTVYDFTSGSFSELVIIDGDTLAEVDTLEFHPEAYIPSMAIDNNGDIYVVYTYLDTMTVNDTLYGGEEGKVAKLNADGSWTVLGYLDGDFTAEDLQHSVWGETSYKVISDGSNLTIPFIWIDGAEDYQNLYFFVGQVDVSGVGEVANAFTPFIVRPTVIGGSGVISFAMPKDGKVEIGLYTLDGRLVKTLYSGSVTSGEHRVSFNTNGLTKGVYLVNFTDSRGTFSRKVVVK